MRETASRARVRRMAALRRVLAAFMYVTPESINEAFVGFEGLAVGSLWKVFRQVMR